jgi:hypothetical protein
MSILFAYIGAVTLIVLLGLVGRRAKATSSYGNYFAVLILSLLATCYAKLCASAGMPLGGDSIIGAGITLVVMLVGVGFLVWSAGHLIKKAVSRKTALEA